MRYRTIVAVTLFAVLAAPAIAFPRRDLALWLQSVTVSQRPDGALVVRDCYDGRTKEGAAFAAGLGGEIMSALGPLQAEFRRRLGAQSMEPALLTRAWRNLAMTEGPALLAGLDSQVDANVRSVAAACTTGRCDCTSCPTGATCDCQKAVYDCTGGTCTMTDCNGPRESCNVTVWAPQRLDVLNDLAGEALGR